MDMDIDPRQASRTKRSILDQLGDSGLLVYACHFPFPALGRIVRQGDARAWQPIDSGS
jgi:hypothetical protein